MDYSKEFLQKIKSFGLLGWDLEKILSVLSLQPHERAQFLADFADEDSVVFAMYQTGLNTGQFNLAAAEYKAKMAEAEGIQLKNDREKRYAELEQKLFG
jgi:hypothetical protein